MEAVKAALKGLLGRVLSTADEENPQSYHRRRGLIKKALKKAWKRMKGAPEATYGTDSEDLTLFEEGLNVRDGAGRVQGTEEPEDDAVDLEEEEMHGGIVSNVPQRRRRRQNHSVYRRLLALVKSTWTGVKTALDSEFEESEAPPRYRPDSLKALCRATKFTEAEIKRIYRGFKAECPTGVIREETFKGIYSQFFPQGANTSQYAHYVFNTLDHNRSGILSFEDFVTGLSILARGSLEEKLKWTFSLYDINGDGCITKDEMTDIITAIYDLMGKHIEPIDEATLKERVDRIFQKMDMNRDGVVTMEEFLDCCTTDDDISASMEVFDFSF